MGNISDESIRARAYQIWEREGRPSGCDFDHWVRAQVELEAEAQAGLANDKPKRARASAAAPRPRPAVRSRSASGRRTKQGS